jgi:hypothetical protein
MAGVVDIVASDIRTMGESDFVASAAALDVPVNPPGGSGLDFISAGGATKFQLGDNILIKKVWAVIPFGFGAGGISITTYLHRITLNFRAGSSFFLLPPLYNGLVIPTLCDPVDFGAGLYAVMNTTGAARSLCLTDIDLRVSMVNLPTALDGQRIQVQYYMEILHNLPMTF